MWWKEYVVVVAEPEETMRTYKTRNWMQKRHFEAIAAGLRQAIPHVESGTVAWRQWHRAVIALADVCENANDGFDRERFYFACGTKHPEMEPMNPR